MIGALRYALVLALPLLVACTVRVQSDPATFDVRQSAVPHLRGQQRIAIANAYDAATVVVVQRSRWHRIEADMHEFTNTAIGILERRLKKDGFAIDPVAVKRVTLRVKNASVLTDGFAELSTITLEAGLGDGTTRELRVRNNSGNIARALDGALVRGITQLLNDEQFLAYLNGPAVD